MARTQQSIQRKGMVAAGAIGAVFVAVIGWFVVRGGPPAQRPPEPPPPLSKTMARPEQPGPDPQLMGSEGFRGDVMDKKDPTRKAGEVSYLKMDPLPGQRWAVEQPDLLMFLKDGRTLHIRADNADLYRPDPEKEPEAGTLTGNVLAEVFDARADGKKIDPKLDQPAGTMRTSSISFDLTLQTVTTDDEWTVKSAGVSMSARGLRAVLNQVRERLEILTIKEQGRIVMRPDQTKRQKPTAVTAKPAPTGVPAPTGPVAAATPAKKPAKPVETLYHAVLERDVKVVASGREVDADQLDLWGRLIEGNLPEHAFAEVKGAGRGAGSGAAKPVGPERSATAEAHAPAVATTPKGVPSDGAPQPAAARGGAEGEIVLTWSGPCTITPLEEAPPELKTEHVAMRMTSPTAGEVKFADVGQGGAGHATAVEYGATTGKLRLSGAEKKPAAFAMAGGRRFETGRIEADLVNGLVHVPGPGVMREQQEAAEGGKPGRLASATWEKQADFTFVVRDGALTNELKQATFDGGFRGTEKDGVLTGEFARADFAPTPEQPFNLTRLIVEGSASAESPEGRVSGDRLDAGFGPSPDGKSPELRTVTVVGNAAAEKKAERLTAQRIEAQLERGRRGPEIAAATAIGGVHYINTEKEITADAEAMRADLGYDARLGKRRQVVDLTGEKVVLSQRDENTVRGTQVRLDGLDQRIQVFGEGQFHGVIVQKEARNGSVDATWADGMIFDSAAGVLDCFGDALVIAMPEPLKRERLEAGRVRVDLVPEARAKSEGLGELDKRLIKSVATGSILERDGGTNARATMEEFVTDESAPDGMRRVHVQYLEGPTIIVDHIAQTLDVPAAGRLLVVDRSDEKTEDGAKRETVGAGRPGTGVVAGSAKGEALFDWDGSLHVEQRAATMEMKRNVRLTRRDLNDGEITNLTCDELTARAATGENGKTGDLKSATAVGAVYVTMGPPAIEGKLRPQRRELVADRAEYDAEKRVIEASASPAGLVTFFDPAQGSVVNAAGLMWDLAQDRIVIRKPGPVTGAAGSGTGQK